MTDTTARLRLPLLNSGQAQKELTHNEALTRIDAAVQPCVEAIGLDVPPATAEPGAAWIVGQAPQGAWAGHAAALACWTDSGWRFVEAFDGFAAWSRAGGAVARFTKGRWTVGDIVGARVVIGGDQVVGPRCPAVMDPFGGATVDMETRTAVIAILTVLREHGLIAG